MTNHAHDAPAWWHYHRKTSIYCDGFAAKGHRALMQFLLVKENGTAQFAAWEDDFRDVHAWLESLRPPKYPGALDAKLVEAGETLFTRHCVKCHGTYGENGNWPDKNVPLDRVGPTDATPRVERRPAQTLRRQLVRPRRRGPDLDRSRRLRRPAARRYLGQRAVLSQRQRPDPGSGAEPRAAGESLAARRRLVRSRANRPQARRDRRYARRHPHGAERRDHYDTQVAGQSNGGHEFAAKLTDDERQACWSISKRSNSSHPERHSYGLS
ncbi:MAG: c-type cytochrome [Pirellulales bacterium]